MKFSIQSICFLMSSSSSTLASLNEHKGFSATSSKLLNRIVFEIQIRYCSTKRMFAGAKHFELNRKIRNATNK
ncbi:hypothetical protein DERP_006373 [Dermatophagoides pteronyssinus]|uniref:Secreted protein n=1 Tax=Dermatophagoides pteronyssinus TaxID=6956 RepID=A0ABQ8IYD4_DERPT|nr:hypothetical protein DERP_006373 [Dermatophagoides pteronyssinus]